MPRGVYTHRRRSAVDRFVDKIVIAPDGCWIWTAARNGNGYAQFGTEGGGVTRGHRFAYEWLIGPIPEGMQLDHLCRVRHCVNPAHLEPVTNRENTLRGDVPRGVCPRGHEKDGWRSGRRGHRIRYCTVCARAAARARRDALYADGLTCRGTPVKRPTRRRVAEPA